MKHYMPTRILSGFGILQKNKTLIHELGKRCLIVTSGHSGRSSGALDDLIGILNEYSVDYEVFDGIRQNPTVASCIEAGRRAHSFGADYLVGIGGGSAMDAAKTAAVVAANPELDEAGIYAQNWTKKPVPLVLIGTTAGTGSEVTYVSVMTNAQGLKKSIHNDDLYALYAFGDPNYTRSMPEKVRISTAIDALAHLLESYFNNNADEISRAYAREGVRLLHPKLKLLAERKDLTDEDLETLYDASILGGLAINRTGTVFCHTLGYYFTENYHLPHGIACAIFTNDLLDYEMENHPEYTSAFFDSLNIGFEELKRTVASLLPPREFTLSDEEIEAMLPRYTGNKSVKNTYGTMDENDIKKILEKMK